MKKQMLIWLLLLLISSAYATPTTTVVEQKKQATTIHYDGNLFASNIIEVQTPANATLMKSYVNFGDRVKQGQLLFEFSSPELQTQLSEAKMCTLESLDALLKLQEWSKSYEMMQAVANLDKAQHELERTKNRFKQTEKLYQKGIIAKEECLLDERFYKDSELQYQNAKRQLAQTQDKASQTALKIAQLKWQQAEAKEAIMQQKLNMLTVHSPIAGTILAPQRTQNSKQVMSLYPHRTFQSSEVIAWVADFSSLCISVKVDELDIVRLQKGQMATITFGAFPKQNIPGQVLEISNQTHTGTKEERQAMTYEVKVALNNIPDAIQDKLLMGMSAKVTLIDEMPAGIWVAKEAVHFENDLPFVFKLNKQEPIRQNIELGENTENEVHVLSGLAEGDRVVLHG